LKRILDYIYFSASHFFGIGTINARKPDIFILGEEGGEKALSAQKLQRKGAARTRKGRERETGRASDEEKET
jgi:hypothetical protein